MEKNKRDFDKRKKAKDKKIEDGDQVIVARRKTTTKTPWNPNPYKVADIHHRRATIQKGWSNLQIDTRNVKKLKSRPPHLQPHREKKHPSLKSEEDLNYDINLPAPPPPSQFRVANIQPVIGRLARRDRWLLAPLSDMFIEPPGL